MLLMYVLAGFMVLGCLAIWRWRGYVIEPPWTGSDSQTSPSIREAIRRYIWYVAVGMAAGLTSGLIMVGIGGRLAMRILAATASDEAQGRLTEASEIVGQITLSGTIGFILFFMASVGIPSAAAYLLIRRWLPRGALLGGLTFGALLLVLFSTQVDPLRPDNIDFDLVGPGWLAVLIFVAMGVGHGMLLTTTAARYSQGLPLISKDTKVLVRYIPAALVLPVPPAAVIALLLGAAYVLTSRVGGLGRIWAKANLTRAGQVIVAVTLVVALPNFLGAVIDIAGRP